MFRIRVLVQIHHINSLMNRNLNLVYLQSIHPQYLMNQIIVRKKGLRTLRRILRKFKEKCVTNMIIISK